MRERPILLNVDMVRAVLNGSKTQTRRIMKVQPDEDGLAKVTNGPWVDTSERVYNCPFGQPGDRLWVRETFSVVPRTAYAASEDVQQVICPNDSHDAAIFRAGWEHSTGGIRWRPSIHMPRWASRITLEITGVRVERLNSMTESDALAEGCHGGHGAIPGYMYSATPHEHFHHIWESIYGADSWQANPWVWVIEFKRVEGE